MKKLLFCVFVFVTVLLVSSCSNGSSGTTMLDIDVRIVPHPGVKERLEKASPEKKQIFEDFSNLFTVLPGPYEFTWEELKNEDGSIGYEQCATKLKIRLRLNKTLKRIIQPHGGGVYYTFKDDKLLEKILSFYEFAMFNSEGKTDRELSDENDDHTELFLRPELKNIWGADGKIGFKENKDGILDFYHFLTSKPGTEFDLILDCGIHLCKEIEDMIAYNKGLYIMLDDAVISGAIQIQYE